MSGKGAESMIVGGSAIALLWSLSGDLGATQCGAPSKAQPTTWNGRSGIWRHNYSVRMACPTAKTTRIKLTRPSPRLVYHCNGTISRIQEGPRPRCTPQRVVPDSLKLRTARFEHAYRRFAELSHIDHEIKLCPLFVDLGDRARSGVQKSSISVCTDVQWESSSHQHLQSRQLSDEVAAKCS